MNFQHFGNRYLEFGNNAIMKLPEIIENIKYSWGIPSNNLVLLTGSQSFVTSESYEKLMKHFADLNFSNIFSISVTGEPSPQLINSSVEETVNRFGIKACKEKDIVVISIGGGSALDAGKALAAMIPLIEENNSLPNVKDYLEGVGTKKTEGLTVPFIACPTTAGTGSEATKNAVISESGESGFKKSLRHDNYIPFAAVIDPALALTCPRSVTAASGLDALTQLIEAWTSPLLTPMMSVLISNALTHFAKSFLQVLDDGNNISAREKLAYAAYISGLALSNCGLGSVHALASTIGGYFSIPHGLICANLIKAGAEINIKKMIASKDKIFASPLHAYAKAGFILTGKNTPNHSDNLSDGEISQGTDLLLETLEYFLAKAALPSLKAVGFNEKNISNIAVQSKAKSNPVFLSAEDYESILRNIL
jgi:alcohol dehydrogenase class IV